MFGRPRRDDADGGGGGHVATRESLAGLRSRFSRVLVGRLGGGVASERLSGWRDAHECGEQTGEPVCQVGFPELERGAEACAFVEVELDRPAGADGVELGDDRLEAGGERDLGEQPVAFRPADLDDVASNVDADPVAPAGFHGGRAYIGVALGAAGAIAPRSRGGVGCSLCTVTFGAGTPNGNCNENQDSDPFTGPDGALYVAFNNYNNSVSGNDNRNQVLLVKSTGGGATFSAPVKVAHFYDLRDCATYQNGADLFRGCVPEQGSAQNSIFRANNYPAGAVNPTNPHQVGVTFGSYINPNSKEPNCVQAGFSSTTGINLYIGVKTPGGCNNDILLSVSNDGGASFTGTTMDRDRCQASPPEPARQLTSGGNGPPSTAPAPSRSPTTTGNTETTKRPEPWTSPCPARLTSRASRVSE